MIEGEQYGYRHGAKGDFVPVEFIRWGRGKQEKKVLVRFLQEDTGHDQYEEYVVPRRLQVPWSEVDELRAKEARWRAVAAVSDALGEALGMAVSIVEDTLLEASAMHGTNGAIGDSHGVSIICDIAQVSKRSGITEQELASHPQSFWEDGRLIVPWPTTRRVIESLVAAQPERLLRQVEEMEEHLAVFRMENEFPTPLGNTYVHRRVEEDQAVIAHLRDWAGAEPLDKWQELIDTRAEARRLRIILGLAIEKLEKYGHTASAKTICGYMNGVRLPSNLKKDWGR
jgi:hypothetical protein